MKIIWRKSNIQLWNYQLWMRSKRRRILELWQEWFDFVFDLVLRRKSNSLSKRNEMNSFDEHIFLIRSTINEYEQIEMNKSMIYFFSSIEFCRRNRTTFRNASNSRTRTCSNTICRCLFNNFTRLIFSFFFFF